MLWVHRNIICKIPTCTQHLTNSIINVSLGIAEYDAETDSSVEDTAKRADEKMYENKRKRKAGRNIRSLNH